MRLKQLVKPVDIRPVPFTRSIELFNADNSDVFASLQGSGSLGSEEVRLDLSVLQTGGALSIVSDDGKVLELQNIADSANNTVLSLFTNRATPAPGDNMLINFDLNDGVLTRTTYAQIGAIAEGTGGGGGAKAGSLFFSCLTGGSILQALKLDWKTGIVTVGSTGDTMQLTVTDQIKTGDSGYRFLNLVTALMQAQNEVSGGGKSLLLSNKISTSNLRFSSGTDPDPDALIASGFTNIRLAATNEIQLGNGGTSLVVVDPGMVIGGDVLDTSALLELESTTQGLLPPRMTTTQRNLIPTPATGLQVFNITNNQSEENQGTPGSPVWVGSPTPAQIIRLTPGGATLPNSNFASLNKKTGSNGKTGLRLDFDSGTDESAEWEIAVGPVAPTAVDFYVIWTSDSATVSGTVEFDIFQDGVANDEPWDATITTVDSATDALIAQGNIHVTSTTGTVSEFQADELTHIKLTLDTSEGTLDDDASVLMVYVKFTF